MPPSPAMHTNGPPKSESPFRTVATVITAIAAVVNPMVRSDVRGWFVAAVAALAFIWLLHGRISDWWQRVRLSWRARKLWPEVKAFEKRARALISQHDGPIEEALTDALRGSQNRYREIRPGGESRILGSWLASLAREHQMRPRGFSKFKCAVKDLTSIIIRYHFDCLRDTFQALEKAPWQKEIAKHELDRLNAALDRWNKFILDYEDFLSRLDDGLNQQCFGFRFDTIPKVTTASS